MVTRNVGGDVGLLAKDVRHVEITGRNRELETTWPRLGDQDAARRARNTMGYQVRPDIHLPRTTPHIDSRLVVHLSTYLYLQSLTKLSRPGVVLHHLYST
ncbi:hypothetical protein V8E52_004316 [Russula decolorans]|jgi:hypothetical protein